MIAADSVSSPQREIQMLFGHCQGECRSALEVLREIREPVEIHCIQFECINAMDPLSAKPCRELRSILVCIHSYARRRLARAM